MYGSRHFADYHALLTLSDAIGFRKVHRAPSIERRPRHPDNFLTDPDQLARRRRSDPSRVLALLERQIRRRPADLDDAELPSASAHRPAVGVRVGMNQYSRRRSLLPARAFASRSSFPSISRPPYAQMDYARPAGRRRRSSTLYDWSALYYYNAHGVYGAIRRNAGDFYTEGDLLWLDVDTIIRERSHGARSLDTFLHRFTEPAVTGPIVVTYTREQVESLLEGVEAYDWHAFFGTKVRLPSGGSSALSTSCARGVEDRVHDETGTSSSPPSRPTTMESPGGILTARISQPRES